MNYLLDISFTIAFTALYMLGGQMHKWTRRIVDPLIALALKARKPKNRTEWRFLGTIFLIPILSMGYGVNSSLMGISERISHKYAEVLTRFIYSLLIVTVIAIVNGFHWTLMLPIIAFQLRAGGFKIYKDYDFLFEDLARGFSIAYALI